MSEPSLLTAHVPLEKASYERFIKQITPAFATAAASIIIDNSEDWLVLRYVKAEQALLLAFVFRWSDQAEAIMRRPYFSELLRVTDFMADGTSGRALISAGAMNFMADEIDAAFTLIPAGAHRDPIA